MTLWVQVGHRLAAADLNVWLPRVLITLVFISPLLVLVPNHPYPQIAGPVYSVRFAAVGLLIYCVVCRPSVLLHQMTPLRWAFLAYVLGLGLTTLTSSNPSLSLWSTPNRMTGVVDQGALLFVAWMLPAFVRDWRWVFAIATGTGMVLALAGLADALVYGTPRPVGLTGNPGFLAIYLAATALAGLFLAASSRRWPLWLIVAATALVVLALTGTRAAQGGAFIGLGILFAFAPTPRLRLFAVLAAVLLGAALMLTPSASRIVSVVEQPHAAPVADRIAFARIALDAFQSRPFSGYGPNAYGVAHAEYAPADTIFADYPHNIFLEELATKGLLALPTLFFGLITARRLILSRTDHQSITALAIVASLAFYGLFWFISLPLALWLTLIAGYVMANERATPKDGP